MIDEDRYCIDVLTQVKAVQAALKKVEAELLSDHADHCLAAAIKSDNQLEREQKVSELIELLMKKLIRAICENLSQNALGCAF